MSETTLSIDIARPGSRLAARDLLMLEQRGWKPMAGYVSAASAVAFIGRLLYGEETENSWRESTDCIVEADGSLVAGVFAYPYIPNLSYNIRATWGELSPGVVEEIEQDEVIHFDLASEARTKYPSQGIISYEVQGELYDRYGSVVALPGLSAAGDTVRTSVPVYGSVRIIYRVLRHTYLLYIERRDPALTVENFYSSVVYAWYDGGGTWIEIEPPPGAEQWAEDTACGWGEGDVQAPGRDGNRPTAAGADRYIRIDYCSGEVRSDQTFEHTEY